MMLVVEPALPIVIVVGFNVPMFKVAPMESYCGETARSEAVSSPATVTGPEQVTVIAARPRVIALVVAVPMFMVTAVRVSNNGAFARVDMFTAVALMVVMVVVRPMVRPVAVVTPTVSAPDAVSIAGLFRRVPTATVPSIVVVLPTRPIDTPDVVVAPMVKATAVAVSIAGVFRRVRILVVGPLSVMPSTVRGLPMVTPVAVAVPIDIAPEVTSKSGERMEVVAVRLVAAATPRVGVIKTGELLNTKRPVPVSSVMIVCRSAEVKAFKEV